MAFPKVMPEEQKVEIVQKCWLKIKKLALDSLGTTNLIEELVQKEGSSLNSVQQAKLAEKLTSWLYVSKTGKYEDFMAFCEPDYWNMSLDSLRWASGKLPQGNTNALDHLPESEWSRVVHDYQTTIRFASLQVNSIHFNLRKWKQRKEDMRKAFLFYSGNSVFVKESRFNLETKQSTIGYRAKPADILKKH